MELRSFFSKFLLFGGVVASTASLAHGGLQSKLLAGLTTPAAPDKEASRLFVEVAAVPSSRGGDCACRKIPPESVECVYTVRSKKGTGLDTAASVPVTGGGSDAYASIYPEAVTFDLMWESTV